MKTLGETVSQYNQNAELKQAYTLSKYLSEMVRIGVLPKQEIVSAIASLSASTIRDDQNPDHQAGMAWSASAIRSKYHTLVALLQED